MILGMISIIIPGLGTWALPKVSTKFLPRLALSIVIHFLMTITFMVKDCNKCRNKNQRRLSSNIHSGNIAIGVSILLNIILKYSSQNIGFLSPIANFYDSAHGIAIMTMLCNLGGMIVSSIVTSIEGRRYCLKPKLFGTFVLGFLISIMFSLGYAGLILPSQNMPGTNVIDIGSGSGTGSGTGTGTGTWINIKDL
jgi:hypothetical protein